jgi:hypothetical protein
MKRSLSVLQHGRTNGRYRMIHGPTFAMRGNNVRNTIRNGLIATSAATLLLTGALLPGAAGASMRTNGEHHHHWRHHHHHLVLTDAQRQCLAGQGITLPTPGAYHDADPSDPAKADAATTDAEKTAMTKPDPAAMTAVHDAFVACGIVLPSRDHDPTPPTTTATTTAPAPAVQSFHAQSGANPNDQGAPSFAGNNDHHFGGDNHFGHHDDGGSNGGGAGWHGGGGMSHGGSGSGGRGH